MHLGNFFWRKIGGFSWSGCTRPKYCQDTSFSGNVARGELNVDLSAWWSSNLNTVLILPEDEKIRISRLASKGINLEVCFNSYAHINVPTVYCTYINRIRALDLSVWLKWHWCMYFAGGCHEIVIILTSYGPYRHHMQRI